MAEKPQCVVILDFGGQYTQLIARRVRELNVYSLVLPYTATAEEVRALEPQGVIFSGGPASVLDPDSPRVDEEMRFCPRGTPSEPPPCARAGAVLCKQFFTGLPTPLIESAKIEGCNQFQIFVKIILPLAKTVLAVMAINTFMSSWNDFFWPFLVTKNPAMYTIQVGLKQFKFANETLFAPMMAGATISALPMFILFFALQKYFMEGVTIGAVKG